MKPTIYKPSIYKGAGIYKAGAAGGGGGGNIEILSYVTNSATGNNAGINITQITERSAKTPVFFEFTPHNYPASHSTTNWGDMPNSGISLFSSFVMYGTGYSPLYGISVGATYGGGGYHFSPGSKSVKDTICRVGFGPNICFNIFNDTLFGTTINGMNIANIKTPTSINLFKNTLVVDQIRFRLLFVAGVTYYPAKNGDKYGIVDSFGNFTEGVGLTGA